MGATANAEVILSSKSLLALSLLTASYTCPMYCRVRSLLVALVPWFATSPGPVLLTPFRDQGCVRVHQAYSIALRDTTLLSCSLGLSLNTFRKFRAWCTIVLEGFRDKSESKLLLKRNPYIKRLNIDYDITDMNQGLASEA